MLMSKKVGTQRDLDRASTEVSRAEAVHKISRDRLALVLEGSRRWQTEQARVDVRPRAQRAGGHPRPSHERPRSARRPTA